MPTTRPPSVEPTAVGAYQPPIAPRAPDPEVHLGQLVRPFLRRWRWVAASLALAWGTALLAILLPAREYTAELTLAAVPSTKTASLTGGISSLLGNMQAGGVQSTPFFVTRLLQLRGVLHEVAHDSAGGASSGLVIERVLDRPRAEIREAEVVPAMRDIVHADVDKQTGLVTFGVSHADSALARHVAERLVDVATARFQSVVRAQASDQRVAGEALVDSTRRQLRSAEERLQQYQSSHRLFEPYARASTDRQRLERDLVNAQDAYNRAMGERQSAIARELEETPAVVVVDPLPAELTPISRGAVVKLMLATVLGLGLVAAVLAARGEFGRG